MRRALFALALLVAVALGGRAPLPGAAVLGGCSSAGAALDPASCSSCHGAIAARHELSAHAKADDSPVFRALRDGAPSTTKSFCDRCHSPRSERGERGVGCLACHAVVGNQGTVNARFLAADEGTVVGPVGATGAGVAAHRTRRESFVTQAELCGTCHEVAGGGAFVETPYSEWSRSASHAQGVGCAACHMAKTPGVPESGFGRGAIAPGVPERDIGDHAFTVDAALFERAAAVEVASANGATTLTVRNRNPAHALPAGARFIRRLTLVATDQAGATQSWDLGDRMTERGVETFDPIAADGHEVRALDATGSRSFVLPTSGAVTAKLVYRRYDDRLLARFGLDPTLSEPQTIAATP